MAKVAVIGSGKVGEVLSAGFLKYGWDVVRGTREPAKLAEWKRAAGAKAEVATFEEAARAASLVVLAVKGVGAENAARLCGIDNLSGKTVIDTTNPIAESPPVNGVLAYFTTMDESLMERLQKLAPAARFVKAFSCAGNAYMVDPDFGGQKPTMFICGNDAAAKGEVTKILDRFGWETEDMGGVEGARAIEPLCILWCLPGFLRGEWKHALKLLKQ